MKKYIKTSSLLAIVILIACLAWKPSEDNKVWLSALDMSKMVQGSTKIKIDENSASKPFSIAKQQFAKGVGTQIKSYVWVDLDKNCEIFSAYVGIDDEINRDAKITSCNFKVFGDDKKLWESGPMRYGEKAKKVEVNVKGVKNLILVVVNLGTNTSFLQADWADAHFTVKGNAPKTIDAPQAAAVILTPKPGNAPEINGPKIYGCGPNHPFLYRIPVTGERPMRFAAKNLPAGLNLDENTGIITGSIKKRGDYVVKLTVKNSSGTDTRVFKISCGDKLALTPPMGWNTWYAYLGGINANVVRDAADHLVSSGMADVGYEYVGIDDCWTNVEKSNATERVGPRRDSNGNILPNSNFPDMKGLVDYIHGKGLKAGIYSSPGPLTCATYTGSYNYEALDAKQFADWGFDLLKYDWCSYSKISTSTADTARQKPYQIMGKLLKEQKRDMLFNICQYGMNQVWTWGASVGGHSWRTGWDLGYRLDKLFEIAVKNSEYAQDNVKPGAWNDPDYIQIGQLASGPTKFPPQEQYSFMSLWSLLPAPLVYSGKLDKLDDFTKNVLCNPEVIAVNQDPLGKPGKVIRKTDESFIMVKILEDGSKAVGLCNSGEVPLTITVNLAEIGLSGKNVIRDLWKRKDIGVFSDKFEATVPRHGVLLVKINKS